MNNYSEKLKYPRWQKKRLEIFQRDEFKCQSCGNTEKTLAVHHRIYLRGKDPWDYPNELLITLCCVCHEEETMCRSDAETYLIEELRKRFWWYDISVLGDAFANMQEPANHSPQAVLSSVIDELNLQP